jgi:hypothetical protein
MQKAVQQALKIKLGTGKPKKKSRGAFEFDHIDMKSLMLVILRCQEQKTEIDDLKRNYQAQVRPYHNKFLKKFFRLMSICGSVEEAKAISNN